MNVAIPPPLEIPTEHSVRGRTYTGFVIPITARGAALLGFAAYLLAGPVARETDIVAAVFATVFIFLVATLLTLTLASGLRLQREFDLSLSFPEGDESGTLTDGAFSGSEVGCLIKIPALAVWPLYVLSVRLVFEEGNLNLPLHRITGTFDGPTLLPQPITFPHRGRWRLKELQCTFGDQFGLSHLRWTKRVDPTLATITVRPPRPRDDSALPVVTSCQRSGDLVTDLHERRGDLFDLKPYHPSDGMRRIVWKIFARRGELVSRQPEASMTPEGQAVIFCLAGDEEDNVCGAALSYIDFLDALGIEIFFGAEGMGAQPAARSPIDGERLAIDSVWEAKNVAPQALTGEIDGVIGAARELLGPTSSIDRVLVFCSAERLGIPGHAQWTLSLARHLESQQIKPVFFVLDSKRREPLAAPPRMVRWLTLPTPRPAFAASSRDVFEKFAATASGAGWEIIRFGGAV